MAHDFHPAAHVAMMSASALNHTYGPQLDFMDADPETAITQIGTKRATYRVTVDGTVYSVTITQEG